MDVVEFDDILDRTLEDASRVSSLDERLVLARTVEEKGALTPTTGDGLRYLLIQSALEMQVQVDRLLYANAAWYHIALLCANATRLYGSRKRVYGILWIYCRKLYADPPSERTFYRLIRLGMLLKRWSLEEEHVFGLTWRQAYNVLTEIADEADAASDRAARGEAPADEAAADEAPTDETAGERTPAGESAATPEEAPHDAERPDAAPDARPAANPGGRLARLRRALADEPPRGTSADETDAEDPPDLGARLDALYDVLATEARYRWGRLEDGVARTDRNAGDAQGLTRGDVIARLRQVRRTIL